jgi:hypothetical protein
LKVENIPNEEPDTVTSSTYENLGSNRTLGFNLNTNLSITTRLSLNLNGQISYLWLKGAFDGEFYSNSGLIGNAFGNIGYKFDKGYRLGLDAGFFSGGINLQGGYSSFIYNSFVFTKEFLNKKATFSLVVNDPESKYHNNSNTTNTPQFRQYGYDFNPYRNYAIRFSYRFGKLKSGIKKAEHSINNDDSKGGGKSAGDGG